MTVVNNFEIFMSPSYSAYSN